MKINLIWLQGQSCLGDTASLIGARSPSVVDVFEGIFPEVRDINLVYHPTFMAEWGEEALKIIDDAKEGKLEPFVLTLEGSIPDKEKAKEGFFCAIGEKENCLLKLVDVLNDLKDKSAAVVAIGSCASYGAIPSAKNNPTSAKGLLYFFTKDYKSTLGLPVICIAGCPAPGDYIIKALAYLVLLARRVIEEIPQLDEYHRPIFLYGERAHETCPRAGYFASGRFSKRFGEAYCNGLLGCKGIITHCTTPRDGFVEGYGGCPTVGSICIGCSEPNFPDKPYSPFLQKAPAWAFVKEAYKDICGHIYAALHRLTRRKI